MATEVCLVSSADECTICVPIPVACTDDPSCGCLPPGTDPAWGASACADVGSCDADTDGPTLTCEPSSWGCG